MRRMLWLCLLVAVIVAGIASQAVAGFRTEENQKYAIYGGVYMPSGSVLKDEGQSIWKNIGLAMSLSPNGFGGSGGYISLEHAATSEGFYSGRRTAVTYTQLFRPTPVDEDSTRGFYYGLGASVNLVKSDLKSNPFVFPPVLAQEESGTQLGLSVLGGYDLGNGIFAELKYNQMGKLADGVDFSGIMVTIGTRSLF